MGPGVYFALEEEQCVAAFVKRNFSFVYPVVDGAWLYIAREVFDELLKGEPFVFGVVFLESGYDGFDLADFLENGGHAVFKFFGGDEIVVHCY